MRQSIPEQPKNSVATELGDIESGGMFSGEGELEAWGG